MSMFDDVEKLPGVITEINSDYSLGYDMSKFGTTDPIILIGTAFKGAVGKMFPIYSPEHGAYIYGEAYNSNTKKEATLTAAIKAAYDSGSYTVYGVRVSGSDIYKDFDLCTDSHLKLRIESYTPNNVKKECYTLIDLTAGAEAITLYKPASEAVLEEKKAGLVESDNSIMQVSMPINQDYGKSADSKLIDVIKIFNSHNCNKSLVMSIVDENGVDKTNSSEAYEICFGAVYPGAYFIGRDKSLCATETDQKFVLVDSSSSVKPYDSFDGVYYRKLVMNTDVSKPIPIYYNDIDSMRKILKSVEITLSKDWDFLAVADATDKAFKPDTVDYEEVDLSKFELYKKLGSGYVITAKAERRTDDAGNDITPRIKQTSATDANAILEIPDGIYSMLENESAKYRVLTCGCADDDLTDKLPKAKEFLTMLSNSAKMFQDKLIATAKVDSANRQSAKAYNFRFESLTNYGADNFGDIYTDVIAKTISSVSSVNEITAKTVESGTYVMLLDADKTGHLKRITASGYENMDGAGIVGDLYILNDTLYIGSAVNGSTVFTPAVTGTNVAGNATYKDKEYVLGENNNNIYAYQVVTGDKNVKPLGDLNGMVNENDDKTLVYLESNPFGVNQVIVRSAAFSAMTLDEFTDFLNNHESLGRYFSFAITEDSSVQKDEIVTDIVTTGFNVDYPLAADRELSYDYTKYIPYKTTDNLARQLAQHCTYTKIKTGPTHGVIGVNTITDVTSSGVAKRVAQIQTMDFDLYAKNPTGRRFLDQNNYPYPIGGNISVTAAQLIVTMDDGYSFTSNLAPSYAGMVSCLSVAQSSTNQKITLSSDPAYTFTNYQLGKLTDKGFVTIKSTLTLGYVITDGITMAPSTSHFRRLSTTRIMGSIEDIIRAACEPFIGKVSNTANKNSMQTAIKSGMDDVKDVLISDYSFILDTSASVAKLNNIAISYVINPLYEIRQVHNTFTIKDAS